MRNVFFLGFALAACGLLSLVHAGCDNTNNSRRDDGTGTGLDGAAIAFSFKPDGCAYTVSPPAALALTDLAVDDPNATADAPVRVRLGLGGNTIKGGTGYADPSTSAAFTWETERKHAAAKIKIGTDPAALTDVHTGYSWTTPPPSIGLGGKEPETYMHEVHVCGLTAGTKYYYQVGGGSPEVWSAVQSFTTVPKSGKLRIGISGDARDRVETWQLVQSRMRDAAVHMQLFSGDLVFVGQLQSLYREWIDAAWKDPNDASKFLTFGQQLFVPVAGNHENEAARFYAAFAMPGDGDYPETYGSFDVGNTHFVMFDDQPLALAQESAQAKASLAWLSADLEKADADRAAHPYIVVLNHRGVYTTSLHATDGDVLLTRSSLAPLFDKHHVDLVMNGHEHEYERSKPLKAGATPSGEPQIQPSAANGTVYVVCAGAGADPYDVAQVDSSYREVAKTFGGSTPYTGVYCTLTLDERSMSLKAYGLKPAGGGIAGDDVIDSLDWTK